MNFNLLDLPGIYDVFPIILNFCDAKTICNIRLSCSGLAEKIRKENVYQTRILCALHKYHNELKNNLCPLFQEWANVIFKNIINEMRSNKTVTESLEQFGTILRQHLDLIVSSQDNSLINSVACQSIVGYFQHIKSTIDEFKVLVMFCNVEILQDRYGRHVADIFEGLQKMSQMKSKQYLDELNRIRQIFNQSGKYSLLIKLRNHFMETKFRKNILDDLVMWTNDEYLIMKVYNEVNMEHDIWNSLVMSFLNQASIKFVPLI